MIRRVYQAAIHIIAALAAGMAVILGMATWQLSKGPVSLAFLSPYVEDVFASLNQSFTVRVDDTIVTWAGWDRALDIRVVNARAYSPAGSLLASVPELSISLSMRAMLDGVIAPERIELFRPSLRLTRTKDGTFKFGFVDETGDSRQVSPQILGLLADAPVGGRAMSFLEIASIIDADLIIEDKLFGQSWHSPSAQVRFVREKDGMSGEIAFDIVADGKTTTFNIAGKYKTETQRIDVGLVFNEMTPALFSRLVPELNALAPIDLPLQGTMTISINLDGKVEMVGFDVTGKDGHIQLPAPLAQTLKVDEVSIKGRFEGATRLLRIDNFFVKLGEGQEFFLPPPVRHRYPLRSFRASATFDTIKKVLDVPLIEADLKGPTGRISARVEWNGSEMTVTARSELLNVPIDKMNQYWPQAWGKHPYNWSVAHLSDGMLRKIRADVEFISDGKERLEIKRLDGDMTFENVSIDYFPPMPKVIKSKGTATFNDKEISFDIVSGESGGLSIREGCIVINGLDKFDQFADIDLLIDGPVRKTLALIDHQPFGYAKVIGIDPEDTSGSASTRLKLNFIVERALLPEQVKVSAVSEMRDVSIKGIVLGRHITDGGLILKVNNRGMNIAGDVKFGPIDAAFVWRENFGDNVNFRSRFFIQGRLGDAQRTSELGFDFPPLWNDVIKGAIDADIHVTVFEDKRTEINVTLDLLNADLSLPKLDWNKPPGIPGTAKVSMEIKGDSFREASTFSLKAGGLEVAGSVRYAVTGDGLERIDLDLFELGRTKIKGVLIPGKNNSWTVSVHGQSFDLAPYLDNIFVSDEGREDSTQSLPTYSLSADVDTVWLGDERKLEGVSGTLISDGKIWRRMNFSAIAEGRKPFFVKIEPKGENRRLFSVTSTDAGAVLRSFDIYKTMIGGSLSIAGEFDDTIKGRPLAGKVEIKDYRVIKAPALAHLVGILALTGLLDELKGEGIGFNELVAPFTLRKGVIEVTDAKAWGLSLGFTASGKVYTSADLVDVEGTIVPAYLLNSFLGYIPILGDILTGGVEGGGVFAARFTMTGSLEDPEVSVNPLSALAPGYLRNLFKIFEGGKSGEPDNRKILEGFKVDPL